MFSAVIAPAPIAPINPIHPVTFSGSVSGSLTAGEVVLVVTITAVLVVGSLLLGWALAKWADRK